MRWRLRLEPGSKLTLPPDLMERLGVVPGDVVEYVVTDKEIKLRRVEPQPLRRKSRD
jgi:antitoxin component of MazEF toxin-antitoxin module